MKSEVYTLDNEVFMNFIFYGTLILIKTVIMSNVTSFFRVKNNAYCSVEDAKIAAPNSPEKQKQFLRRNEDVERVRNAHLNDLENAIPFVLLSLLYIAIEPDPATALLHFRVFFFARVFHSIVYVSAFPQPFRFFSYVTGYVCFFSMAIRILAVYR